VGRKKKKREMKKKQRAQDRENWILISISAQVEVWRGGKSGLTHLEKKRKKMPCGKGTKEECNDHGRGSGGILSGEKNVGQRSAHGKEGNRQ